MNGVRPLSYDRFSVGQTVTGYEVIDSDGRPVSESYVDPQVAMQVKDELNLTISSGNVALCFGLEEAA